MNLEMLKEFIKPELLILIPVLYLIGISIKNTLLIKDKFIPLVLGISGNYVSYNLYICNRRNHRNSTNF